MRALVLAPALALAAAWAFSLSGCIGGEPVRAVDLAAGPGGNFTFLAHTNTVMTENDDGAAERIRRDWLAQALNSRAICRQGYVVDNRQFVPAQAGIFGNGGEIVYAGRCL